MSLQKNNSKTINAWCMYDWANSVFSLTITTAVFPEYFLGITSKEVHMFGLTFENEVIILFPPNIRQYNLDDQGLMSQVSKNAQN